MRYPSSHSRIDPATYGLPLTQASTGDPSTYQDKIQKRALTVTLPGSGSTTAPPLPSSLRSVASAEAPRFLPSRRRCLRETDPSRSAGRETKAALRSGENGER
ncbi:hypothetical protein MJT46_012659 [Ovis ammon polii x Ovis aries]|nr:hypothetical protein MJT46_012659 [Ovis ammon polii x Ovis aries]